MPERFLAREDLHGAPVPKLGMASANRFSVNAVIEILSEAVERVFSFLAPSVSFGLYAGAEILFLYGLYMVFFGSPGK
jgi:hypothetical protein